MVAVFANLSSVLAHEEILKQVAEELQRNVFECKGWAVEELHQVQIRIFIQRNNWCLQVMSERAIRIVDDLLEILSWNFGWGDVEGDEVVCQIDEGEVLPLGLPVWWELGDGLGDEEAAVAGEAFEYDIFEGEL